MVIDSKVINDKVGWRLNVKNKFQDLRRLSIRLATVMFMGTPCIRTPPPTKIKQNPEKELSYADYWIGIKPCKAKTTRSTCLNLIQMPRLTSLTYLYCPLRIVPIHNTWDITTLRCTDKTLLVWVTKPREGGTVTWGYEGDK